MLGQTANEAVRTKNLCKIKIFTSYRTMYSQKLRQWEMVRQVLARFLGGVKVWFSQWSPLRLDHGINPDASKRHPWDDCADISAALLGKDDIWGHESKYNIKVKKTPQTKKVEAYLLGKH